MNECAESADERTVGETYEQAFTSWDDEGEAAVWDGVAADGLEK